MLICTKCGEELPERARFCLACGAPVDDGLVVRELRKIVTVVFSDVAGSTAIGERLDPEPLRRLMLRWYEAMRAVCEAHGGRVRGLIGDAVMAVFGIPAVHEDDALRAVRAAAGMRERLEQLNGELEREFGLRVQSRTGVNTGEVIVRDPDPSGALALGDAVNVAARLQSAAEPGEILVGQATYGLVSDAVRAEPVEPLELKGKSDPVPGFRLLEVFPHAEAVARHLETPLVGRELELAQLRQAYERARRERRCHLVTVFGLAGIGKTRLAHELARSVEAEATVLTGRCLSYGEGITYWPIREIVAQATDGRGIQKLLDGSPDAEIVAERLDAAIGAGTGGAVKEETFWAVRRLVEALAGATPVVLVFEDVHWGEPTLLDLIEHLADWVRDVPVLVICLARPELLDERPAWGGGKLNASSLLLEPLSRDESSALIDALPVAADLPPGARTRIEEAAEGNPLFLEQMLALLAEGENAVGEIAVPPAIQALLVARLERLEPDERRLLEHASIEGEAFHVGGVVALSIPATREEVESRLMRLVHKELIRAEGPTLLGEEAFGFRHALIRDAAYEGVPKEVRADLHERYGAWLEQALGDRLAEGEEFLGYHLEQAYRYRAELGPIDENSLADRACRHLASAGRLALRRGDMQAAVNLLERARSLPASDERARLELAPDLGFALIQVSEFEQADSLLTDAIQSASAIGELHAERHAWLVQEHLRLLHKPERIDFAESLSQAEESLAMFQKAGNNVALARAWMLLRFLYQCTRRAALQRDAAERAREHARLGGSRLDEVLSLAALGWSLIEGPTPVSEGVGICTVLADEVRGDPVGEATVTVFLACLVAMQGLFDDAREMIVRSREVIREFGVGRIRAHVEMLSGRVETLAGDLEATVRTTRAAAKHSAETGDNWVSADSSVQLARAICDSGDPAECLRILDESEARPVPPDIELVVGRPATRALALARLGRLQEAETLAREAVGTAEGTEFLVYHADALLVLAEVLRLAGRPEEAASTLEDAVALHERKGNVVSAAKARALLEEVAA